MENKVGRLHIGHISQIDLHVGTADTFCRTACIGVYNGIAPARYDDNGMGIYGRWGGCKGQEIDRLIVVI